MTDCHTQLEQWLQKRGVGTAIIERVLRLNPVLVEGQRLRGIHFKDQDNPCWLLGAYSKGAFIAKFGRDAFNAIPKHRLIKRGRRVWVEREAVEDRIWAHRSPVIRAQCPNSP